MKIELLRENYKTNYNMLIYLINKKDKYIIYQNPKNNINILLKIWMI